MGASARSLLPLTSFFPIKMPQRLRSVPLFLVFSLVMSWALRAPSAQADHLMAAELGVEVVSTSPATYNIDLILWSDCDNGAPLQIDNPETLTNLIIDGNCALPDTLIGWTLVDSGDVTSRTAATCPSAETSCSPPAGGQPGFFRLHWQLQLRFPAGATCPYRVTFEQCCREPSITSINNPQIWPTFLEVSFVPAAGLAVEAFSSPPTADACLGDPLVLAPDGPTDSDLVRYSREAARGISGSPLSYASNFSAEQPGDFSTLWFDDATGAFGSVPSQQQVFLLKLRATRSNGDSIVAERVRENLVVVQNCPGSSPISVNGLPADTALPDTATLNLPAISASAGPDSIAGTLLTPWPGLNANLPAGPQAGGLNASLNWPAPRPDTLWVAFRFANTACPVRDQAYGWMRVRNQSILSRETNREAEPGFQVVPNPARRDIQIQRPPEQAATSAPLQLLDLNGRVLREWTLRRPSTTLSVAGVPAGVYLLRSRGRARRLLILP